MRGSDGGEVHPSGVNNKAKNINNSDGRLYPLEEAYGLKSDTPAWKRISPNLSGGWAEIHDALECEPWRVTTS